MGREGFRGGNMSSVGKDVTVQFSSAVLGGNTVGALWEGMCPGKES